MAVAYRERPISQHLINVETITQSTHIECITSITQYGLVALYWQTPLKKCKNRQKLTGKSVNP
jgi:hypothetical protein